MENDCTFVRELHDSEHPFVMINKEMLRDKSISPKAKGILCYLLSLPDKWIVYHHKVCEALDIGKDYLNRALNELEEAGYMMKTRERVNGTFQPYKYKFSEFKKFPPKRENRSGKPALNNNRERSENGETKKQQQEEKAAAIFDSEKKDRHKRLDDRPKAQVFERLMRIALRFEVPLKTEMIEQLSMQFEEKDFFFACREYKKRFSKRGKTAENCNGWILTCIKNKYWMDSSS